MTSTERRAVGALAGIYALRMLGLFLILPVFTLYARHLEGTTPFLVGMALGAYGLTQALLQIPFGMASDRLGRKPMIAAGLLLFAAGSVVAALADSIHGVIAGRALQGTGAIAAVVIALTADLTRETQRTKAMALLGVTIGATFLMSLILGPLFNNWFGVRGIFWMTAVLAIGGLAVLFVLVPTPLSGVSERHRQPAPKQLMEVLRDGQLRRLDFGIFMLHLMLTAMFVVVPVALMQEAGIPAGDHWKFYLSVIGLSVLGMVPLVALSARKHLVRRVFAAAVALIGVGQLVLAVGHAHLAWLASGLWVFFVGFNVLEALLPSLVSRIAPAHSKGGAVGVYNSAEFFGAFLGGAAGGLVYGAYGVEGVFAGCTVLALIWLAVAVSGPAPRLLDTHLVEVGARGPDEARTLARRLSDVPGVAEVVVVAEEGVAYLKVDSRIFDRAAVEQITAGAA